VDAELCVGVVLSMTSCWVVQRSFLGIVGSSDLVALELLVLHPTRTAFSSAGWIAGRTVTFPAIVTEVEVGFGHHLMTAVPMYRAGPAPPVLFERWRLEEVSLHSVDFWERQNDR
jgi:hypothetical protein